MRRWFASLALACLAVTDSSWSLAQEDSDEAGEEVPSAGAQSDQAERPRGRRKRAQTATTPTGQMVSPHGNRPAQPRIVPAPDLALGEIEVRLNSKKLDGIDGQEVRLEVSQQSIERGNTDSVLTATTDERGVARFPAQPVESDFVYQVRAKVGIAQYSTIQFQFKAGDTGLRVLLPVFESQTDVAGLMILSRVLYALVPQDDLFAVDVLWRIENYSEVSWTPDNVVLPLPEGFKALTIKNEDADAKFEPAGEVGVKFAGTFSPGQHDLLLRFHLPTEGESERKFTFPTFLNVGTVRVLLDTSPTMTIEIDEFGEPNESRNQQGQRRLVLARDYLTEKVKPPKEIEVRIAGIPTPPAGRTLAVALAGVIALGGIAESLARRRYRSSARSQLSKEDLERARELLLNELVSLEQAFQQGTIGRKTHEQARRQVLEAFARLGTQRQARA